MWHWIGLERINTVHWIRKSFWKQSWHQAVILQGAPSQTCTAWWLPDTSSSLRSRPKAWQLHRGWSSSPQSTLVSLSLNSRFKVESKVEPPLLFRQSHYSIKKASAALGFGTENLILLDTDDRFSIWIVNRLTFRWEFRPERSWFIAALCFPEGESSPLTWKPK